MYHNLPNHLKILVLSYIRYDLHIFRNNNGWFVRYRNRFIRVSSNVRLELPHIIMYIL